MSDYREKECMICRAPFKPQSGASKYCSDACRKVVKEEADKRYYEEYKEGICAEIRRKTALKPPAIRECKVCGIEFVRSSNQLYCSEACSQQWHSMNPERIKRKAQQGKEHYERKKSTPEGREEIRRQSKEARVRHKEKHGISSSRAAQLRNPYRGLHDRIRSKFHQWIKGTGGEKTLSMSVYCGCTRKEMNTWLESQFEPWMTWENSGQGEGFWAVDHIRPLSSFQGTEEQASEELAQCAWNWRNLRPLDYIKNSEKGDRYTHADEAQWVEYMHELGWNGDLFLLFRE